MQRPIYPFYVIWAIYVLKIKFSNDLEQIKKIKVKTSEDVLPSFRENRES